MTYQIAPGHDEIPQLVLIDPQPRCNGIFYAGEEIFAGDGTVYEDGEQYSELIFSIMLPEDYDDFNIFVGLDTAKSAPVTVTLPNERRTAFSSFNGIIVKPRNLKYQYWYQDVIYRIKNLSPAV